MKCVNVVPLCDETVYNNTNFFLVWFTGGIYLGPHAQMKDMDEGRCTRPMHRWAMYECRTDANLKKRVWGGGSTPLTYKI